MDRNGQRRARVCIGEYGSTVVGIKGWGRAGKSNEGQDRVEKGKVGQRRTENGR